jgi:NitT/TauT family transport system ATP-binding protein
VYLADRVVILGSKPVRIRGELQVNLPRPHDRNHPRFKALVDYIYSVMTNPDIAVSGEVEGPESGAGPEPSPQRNSGSPFSRPLPHVRVGGISGLLELFTCSGHDAKYFACVTICKLTCHLMG